MINKQTSLISSTPNNTYLRIKNGQFIQCPSICPWRNWIFWCFQWCLDCPYCLCKNFQYVPYLVYFVKFEFLFQCAIIILVILLILYLSGCKSCGCRTRQRRSENGPGNVDKERSVAIAFECRISFIIFGSNNLFSYFTW